MVCKLLRRFVFCSCLCQKNEKWRPGGPPEGPRRRGKSAQNRLKTGQNGIKNLLLKSIWRPAPPPPQTALGGDFGLKNDHVCCCVLVTYFHNNVFYCFCCAVSLNLNRSGCFEKSHIWLATHKNQLAFQHLCICAMPSATQQKGPQSKKHSIGSASCSLCNSPINRLQPKNIFFETTSTAMMFLRQTASSFSAFLAVSASPLISTSERCQAAYMAASKSLVWFPMRGVKMNEWTDEHLK